MFELLRELGLFALPLPAEYGGTGSLLAGCIAVEEFGRVCYNTGYLLVVQWVAFGALHAAGNAEQKARFLPGLATARCVARSRRPKRRAARMFPGSGRARRALTAATGSTARRSGARIPMSPTSCSSARSAPAPTARTASTCSSSRKARRASASAARKTRWARAAFRRARCSSTTCSFPKPTAWVRRAARASSS